MRNTLASLSLASITVAASALAASPDIGLPDYLGPRFSPRADSKSASTLHVPALVDQPVHILRHWNEMALDATGLDHTPVALGENRIFGEQLGPTRAGRAMAIIHIAMFDAVVSIRAGYESYTHIRPTERKASVPAALAQAAHDTLIALYPSQRATFDAELDTELGQIRPSRWKNDGADAGRRAAAAILALRAADGAAHAEPHVGTEFVTSDAAGKWRQDPISHSPVALGAFWGVVRPFVLQSATQFRAPTPPDLTSPEYAAAYNEVKLVGGDGLVTPTVRTADQTAIGTFWAYDGTPTLCAPPRLYNQITMLIADQMGTTGDVVALSRLLALANVSMADAGIAVWESKFFYQYWRPITGIRESDLGTGPSGTGDANSNTVGDPTFTPLGAPASNLNGPNFTPPFPSYPSGHAGIGGALFQTLRDFYQTDQIAFTFTSDEFNGITRDHGGNVRPLVPRSFATLSQAEEENGQSRIYLGIHWSFDKSEGIAQGRKVADYIFSNAFRPLRGKRSHPR
jgi:hypothetical protein